VQDAHTKTVRRPIAISVMERRARCRTYFFSCRYVS
jgi:hypothetical protein